MARSRSLCYIEDSRLCCTPGVILFRLSRTLRDPGKDCPMASTRIQSLRSRTTGRITGLAKGRRSTAKDLTTWRCLFCIRPAETVGAGYHGNFLDLLADFGPRDLSQRLGNGHAMHLGGFSGPGDHSGPISGNFRRFRARPIICDLNIVTLPQLRGLRLEHCVLTQDRCLFLQQKRCLLLRQG